MSELKKARLVFIGAGAFATHSLYPCIPSIPCIDLLAVCDLDREKAQTAARNFGAQRVYTDIEEMLDREQPDGAFCIGPAPLQYELAPLVLRRGIPVFVEKPSAVTTTQARELAKLAEAHNTWGQVGFMKRFAAVYKMVKEITSRPDFGSIHVLKVRFTQGPYPQIWGIDSANRAMLIAQLCHVFDLARFIGGDISQVSAQYLEVTPNHFAYTVNARYSSGAVGNFDLSSLECHAAFRDIKECLEVVGFETNLITEDMLSLRWQAREDWTSASPFNGRYVHSFEPAWTGIHPTSETLGYTGEIEHFARRCLGEAAGGPDLWDSYKSLQIGEAIYESARTFQWVTIE